MVNKPKKSRSDGSQIGEQIIIRPRSKNTNNRKIIARLFLWVLVLGAVVIFSLATGSFAGYQTGSGSQKASETMMAKSSIEEQFTLAVQDLTQGRYEVAFRRLEYVIGQDPSYPGATDKMAEVMAILYATATPTNPAPTITATATRDLRPVEEMFAEAEGLFNESKWGEAIDRLTTLRKEDPAYQTARVDGMLFLALRMRGYDKIWKSGDLEGGLYDLALASRFGPLDTQANSARDLARLYLIGSSFWEVDPAQAIQYFSQVAAAAPNLLDASGWTASARYREVLIQYGDKLYANKDWCQAQQQFELALSMGADAALQEKANNAALQCSPPSATPSATGGVPTTTVPSATTPSPTWIVPSTSTNTQQAPPSSTNTSPPPIETTEPPISITEPPLPTETTAAPPEQSPQAPYPG